MNSWPHENVAPRIPMKLFLTILATLPVISLAAGEVADLSLVIVYADDRVQQPAVTWREWEEAVAYSQFNHHFSGVVLLLVGGLALLGAARTARAGSGLRYSWSLFLVVLGIFVLIMSDEEAWPIGPAGLIQSMTVREVREHKISGIVVLAIGAIEFLKRRGDLSNPGWGYFFPGVAVVAGIMLITHRHEGIAFLGRTNVPHITEGITSCLVAGGKVIDDRELLPRPYGAILWPLLVVGMALQLLIYME